MSKRTRTSGINIRVTPDEKKKIERKAKKSRLSVSEYIRKTAVGSRIIELPGDKLYEVYLELCRLKSQENMQNLDSAIEKLKQYILERYGADNGDN